MNTTDVRDMPFGQWLYWATALPVTLVVIVGGLWWMNELGNVMAWATGQKRHRPDAAYPSAAYPSAAVTGPTGQPPLAEDRPQLISMPEPKESRTYQAVAYSPPAPRAEKVYETTTFAAPVERMERTYEPETYSVPRPRRDGPYEDEAISRRRASRAHQPEAYVGPMRRRDRRYDEELLPYGVSRPERRYFNGPSSPVRPRMRAVYRY
jgi:hypothetical protein